MSCLIIGAFIYNYTQYAHRTTQCNSKCLYSCVFLRVQNFVFFSEINRRIIVIIVVYKKMYFMLSRPQNFWISTRCHHTWRLNWIKISHFPILQWWLFLIGTISYSICFYIYCNVIITYRAHNIIIIVYFLLPLYILFVRQYMTGQLLFWHNPAKQR